LNPKYKRIGLLAFPYYWLFEVIGPFLDLMGYIAVPVCFALGIVSLRFMLTFFAIAILYGIVLGVGSLILEEDMVKRYPSPGQLRVLSFYSLLENIGYQQMISLMRILAVFTYRKNKRTLGK
ncbi:MAG: glycosyltransferase family 2 protein, partial [Oscillospiraceae bacterium]